LRPVVTELETRPNVHFLGEKSSRELARYPQHFDVGIMPYTVDGYTKYISPLKLHEYLAAGKPVVGSSIRTLRDFAHIIGLADGVEEWSRALEKALQPDENLASAREARQTVARAYDWATLTDRVSDVLERCLEGSPGDQ
ncbi:MAG: glycosyltransferase, partial [Gemmatimonadota bacterium]